MHKSREEAMQLKSLGNVHFRERNCLKALECYTKAILLAPYSIQDQQHFLESSLELLKESAPSKHEVAMLLYATETAPSLTETVHASTETDPLLSQCFGNRSAVLYEMEKYNECQSSIDWALMLGYPTASVHKLQSRREKCQHVDSLSTTSSHEDMSAFQPDAISVLDDTELGRHMIAARDLAQGDVILSEESYASVLDPSFVTTHCSYCFQRAPYSIIPCVLCACEGYCCAECRQTAWTKYHWMECTAPNNWRKVNAIGSCMPTCPQTADQMEILCLRIVVSTSPADILNACRGRGLDLQGDYDLIYKLISHEGKYSNDDQQDSLKKAAKNLIRCFGMSILSYILPSFDAMEHQSDLLALEELFFRHLLQLRCNSHAVSQVLGEEECYLKQHGGGLVETVREVRIGSVLLRTASLVNHSCLPNAMFRFLGNRVVVCVTKDLRMGDHINNSYGPQVGRMKTAQRKQELREKYFFDCHCTACDGSDESCVFAEAVMDGLACLGCNIGALVAASNEENSDYVCCHCQTIMTSKDISKQIEMKKKAEVLFESAANGREVHLDSLLEVHKMQTSTLHRYNRDLAKTSDLIAQAYTHQGKFALACKYLERSCCSVGATYGEQSIEFANEMQKMASILFHSGDMDKALKTATKAKSLLSIYHGSYHPDYREMDEMINFLNSQL